jgi:hypothetical protein
MATKRKLIVVVAILLIAIPLAAGILMAYLEVDREKETNMFTYPLSVGDKTFIVTVETNWNAERAPSVSLINVSDVTRYAIELYFLGGSKKTISYNITIPTDLLWGNISLIWKYYLQNPVRYTLSNNGTHNSLQTTFDYEPFFSGMGILKFLAQKEPGKAQSFFGPGLPKNGFLIILVQT